MKSLFFAFLVFCSISAFSQEKLHYININGTSELVTPADQIDFTIQIKSIGSSLEKSKSTNDKNLQELKDILVQFGIGSHAIEVSPIIVGKNNEYVTGKLEHKGYFTEISISFVLRDLTKYFDLSNRLCTNNSFEITNSQYSLSDYEAQHKIANENALKAAKDKAEYMSKSLGLKLGDVLEIEENSFTYNYTNPLSNTIVSSSEKSNSAGKVTLKRTYRVKFAVN